MPDAFETIICDGPPGKTRGGRYGLAAIMKAKPHLKPGCIILLDDAERQQDHAAAERWSLARAMRSSARGSPISEREAVDGSREPALYTGRSVMGWPRNHSETQPGRNPRL